MTVTVRRLAASTSLFRMPPALAGRPQPCHLHGMMRFWLFAPGLCVALACSKARPSDSKDSGVAVTPPVTASVLEGIDHFFATSTHPESLYRVFRDSLGLPEVYPFRNYGDFASGLVSMGNALFEVVTWAVPAGEVLPTEFKGLAFAPSARLPETLAGLRARGIALQKPDSVLMTNAEGARVLAYVNIPLDGPGGLPPTMASIFINDNLGKADADERRRDGADELARRLGGPLGVLGVKELVIAVPDRNAALSEWRKLLASPAQENNGVITWPVGPEMRFVTAAEGAIPEMVVRVRSLPAAVRFLSMKGILRREGEQVLIDPRFVGGLRIRLVD